MNISLFNDDCMNVFKSISDESIDLLLTDCPYHLVAGGVSTDNPVTPKICLDDNKTNVKSGKLFDNNDIEFSEWLPEVYRILKSGCHAYIMINARNLKDLWQAAEDAGFIFQNILIWDKGNVTANRYYMQGYEMILMLRKGKARTINNAGTSNILKVPNIIGNKRHPTEKPVELMKIMIENSTNEGDVVLDPFSGSGAVGVACKITGRSFIGVEIDEQYYDIMKQRIDTETEPKKQISIFDI